MTLPKIPRRRPAATGGIPASLPIEIQPRGLVENSVFSIAPKTSLVDRTGIRVPPLPLSKHPSQSARDVHYGTPHTSPPPIPGNNDNGTRNRSRSISSVARDRTYAARDVSQMRDPGESLVVPEEEEDEVEADDVPIEDGISKEDKGRLNAYRILARQTNTPDETMWRSIAG